MKIISISSVQPNKTSNAQHIGIKRTNFRACFAKNVDRSAKWSWNKLRILERSDSEMRDMAEYFHKESDWELQNIAKGNTWFVADEKIQKAYQRLKRVVDEVNSKRKRIEEQLSSGDCDGFTRSIMQDELRRLDEKAANRYLIEKLFKK